MSHGTPGHHKKRDLTLLIRRIQRNKDKYCTYNPTLLTLFDTALLCIKTALELRASQGFPKTDPKKIKLVLAAYKNGEMTNAEIASTFGISLNTLYRAKRKTKLFKNRLPYNTKQLPLPLKG